MVPPRRRDRRRSHDHLLLGRRPREIRRGRETPSARAGASALRSAYFASVNRVEQARQALLWSRGGAARRSGNLKGGGGTDWSWAGTRRSSKLSLLLTSRAASMAFAWSFFASVLRR